MLRFGLDVTPQQSACNFPSSDSNAIVDDLIHCQQHTLNTPELSLFALVGVV